MALIFCSTEKQSKLFREKLVKYNTKIIDSTCDGLYENLPVVVRIPDGTFFSRVTPERIVDVYHGHADDLKIQTARLYDVDMEKFMSEPLYRKVVQAFALEIDHIETWDSSHIASALEHFYTTQTMKKELVNNAIKVALLKTTRCPLLLDVLTAFTKDEVTKLLEDFSSNYKRRI